MYKTSRAWDPLYGLLRFTKSELELMHLPEIQRLRYVRLCNINSLLITGAAEPSRFEHSLGVMHLAKTWADAHRVGGQPRKDLIAAALFHDLQTGPFGHSFQYILEERHNRGGFIHDDLIHGYKCQYHQRLWANSNFAGVPFQAHKKLGPRWDVIANLIKGKGRLGPLISGSMDLDNIDNVLRLAYHAGLARTEDTSIGLKLARDIVPDGDEISISYCSADLVRRWQTVRRRLYEFLLLDWADFSAKGMLTKALEMAIDFSLIGPQDWLRTDDELIDRLQDSVGGHQLIRELVRRIRVGDLFSPLMIGRSSHTDLYDVLFEPTAKRKLEAEIQQILWNTARHKTPVLVHFIQDQGRTSRAVKVLVRDNGKSERIGSDSSNLFVGVFLSVPPRRPDQEAAAAAVVAHFKRGLVDDLAEVEDPMDFPEGDDCDQQLPLL